MVNSVYFSFVPAGNKGANQDVSNKGDAGKKKINVNSSKKEAKELQALAFGGASKKKSNKKKSGKSSGNLDQQQFEDWKVKDVEVGQFHVGKANVGQFLLDKLR